MTYQLKLKAESATDQKLDKVAQTYVKIRDARSALKKQYEVEDLKLKSQLEILDGFLLGALQNLGAESVRTKYGTVFRSIDTKASCQDWNAFYAWIAENKAFDALERRVKQSFIATYMEGNKGGLPPGVSVLKEYAVTVRRS